MEYRGWPVGGTQAKWISGLALTGMLMPIGILTEVYPGFPPYLVLLGATAMVIAAAWLGLAVLRMRIGPGTTIVERAVGD